MGLQVSQQTHGWLRASSFRPAWLLVNSSYPFLVCLVFTSFFKSISRRRTPSVLAKSWMLRDARPSNCILSRRSSLPPATTAILQPSCTTLPGLADLVAETERACTRCTSRRLPSKKVKVPGHGDRARQRTDSSSAGRVQSMSPAFFSRRSTQVAWE
jgi:hypothetical protein